MNLAQQALSANNLGRARELLARYLPGSGAGSKPIPIGDSDLRGWEWAFLWENCRIDALFDLCQLPDGVSSLSVRGNGDWVAVGEYPSGGLSVWDLRSRKEVVRLNQGSVQLPFQFSPTAPLLAYASPTHVGAPNPGRSGNHVILLWHGQSREITAEFRLEGECAALAFSPDGSELLTVTHNLIATTWDVSSGEEQSSVTLPGSRIPRGRFGLGPCTLSPDLSWLAHATRDRRIRLVHLASGQVKWSVDAVEESVMKLAFSADGNTLASSGGYVESSIRLWDVASGVELARLDGHRTYVQALVFWPDGQTLASASADQTIQLWSIGGLRELQDTVAAVAAKGRRWRPLTYTQPKITYRGHQGEVWSLALLPDKRTLISGGKDGVVSVWDTTVESTGNQPVILPVSVKRWSFGPDGRSLLVLDAQGRLQRWHGDRFQEHHLLLDLGPSGVDAVFAEDGEVVAVHRPNQPTEIYDLRASSLRTSLGSADPPEIPLTFIGHSHRLVTRDRTAGSLRVWNLDSGQEELSPWKTAGPKSGSKITFSPNGQWSLRLDGDGTGTLRHAPTEEKTRLDFQLTQIDEAAFSPDDRFLAIVSWLGEAQIWDVEQGTRIAVLRAFLQGQHSVAFSPDGRRLAIGSNAREAVKLWDVESLQELITLEGKGSMFNSLNFSPDGRVIAACNSKGLLHLWQAPSLNDIAPIKEP